MTPRVKPKPNPNQKNIPTNLKKLSSGNDTHTHTYPRGTAFPTSRHFQSWFILFFFLLYFFFSNYAMKVIPVYLARILGHRFIGEKKHPRCYLTVAYGIKDLPFYYDRAFRSYVHPVLNVFVIVSASSRPGRSKPDQNWLGMILYLYQVGEGWFHFLHPQFCEVNHDDLRSLIGFALAAN